MGKSAKGSLNDFLNKEIYARATRVGQTDRQRKRMTVADLSSSLGSAAYQLVCVTLGKLTNLSLGSLIGNDEA